MKMITGNMNLSKNILMVQFNMQSSISLKENLSMMKKKKITKEESMMLEWLKRDLRKIKPGKESKNSKNCQSKNKMLKD
jgi:hypothetical protein